MNHEFELKLEIPAASMKAVKSAVSRLRGKTQLLRATYFDTTSRDLQQHGLVLRVRREGKAWLQTLKAEGERPLERLEHEVPLQQAGDDVPLPNAALHEGSNAGALLRKALHAANPAWTRLFSTEVERTTRLVTHGASK